MRSIADQIEQHLKQLLSNSTKGSIEVQRNELAEFFSCVPSQINYVLSTRFTFEQGYLVESRRGGGGFLRIIRLPLTQEEEIYRLIDSTLDNLVSQRVGEGLIKRLLEEGFLTKRESLLARAVIQREAIPIALPERDLVRAHLLRVILLTIMREEFN
jgi:transcriptional regulator CtsR